MFFLMTIIFSCTAPNSEAQTKKVGGPCEGCEAIFEYGERVLTPTDTLPGFKEEGTKLKVTGTILQNDGKTPAKDVILYIYHTDSKGIYTTRGGETGWARRHGYHRGWIKTDVTGKYSFYTIRPASYPESTEPQHIHATVKEPGRNEYYIDSYLFDDDPMLTKQERAELQNRGGSGIVVPRPIDGMLIVERDIILGQNIPGYE